MLPDGAHRDNQRMHLLLPFAAAVSEAGAQAVRHLSVPNLQRALTLLRPTATLGTDEQSLNLPHEHVLAQLQGWPDEDGLLPFAAQQASHDGLEVGEGSAWGLLTPSHWQLGREQVSLVDPAALQLHEGPSRELLQSVRELFESLGWSLHWAAPLRWYARHESLGDVPTASLDRVIGRAIDAWLPARKAGAAIRRLQSEVQMLLHQHPINDQREAQGELPVNAFWLSGTGRARTSKPIDGLVIDERLREPHLAGDWPAWVEAWQGVDTQRLAELVSRAKGGEPVQMTLCGDRHAQRFESVESGRWQRLTARWRSGPAVVDVLEAL